MTTNEMPDRTTEGEHRLHRSAVTGSDRHRCLSGPPVACLADSSLLLVDDDVVSIRVLQSILTDYSHLRFATNGEEALRLAGETPPDLILLDADMPGLDGFGVCNALKRDERLAHIPVIFVTSHEDVSVETRALELGAMDFIAKPVSPARVRLRVRNQLLLKYHTDRLRREVSTDPLTGLHNRRALESALPLEWRRAQRHARPLSLLMVDVDHFKRVNDRYGHAAGDACLRAVAAALESCVGRPGDLVARFGGEEFTLLLPETPLDAAMRIADEIHAAMESLEIPFDDEADDLKLTVSIGIATCGVDGERGPVSERDLLSTADKALYRAKHAGRNRTCTAGVTGPARAV
ncbi:MAG: diguanylate cyclase [Rhodocyclaceae bacterium]|nr:diguanylate cyclase [Rhodocyclaceae bacterium]